MAVDALALVVALGALALALLVSAVVVEVGERTRLLWRGDE